MSVHHLYGEMAAGSPWSQQPQSASPWSNQSQSDGSAAAEWFHGVTSRKDAETLLMCKPPGCFLIRVGESRNGFTLSYRATDHCRHFMIDELRDGNYVITGESTRHRSLQDLVDFHCRTPIMPFTELLTVPCTKVNGVQPTALPGHTDAQVYSNTQADPPPESPSELPRPLETHGNGWLYPTLSSAPSALAAPALEQGAPQDKRPEPKPSAVPGQTRLMGLFRKKKGGSQEGPPTGEGDDGLPEEYLQPPPFAPGFC